MARFIQFDAVTGALRGSLESVETNDDGTIKSPRGTVVIDAEARPEAATAVAYDAETDAFRQPAASPKRLSRFECMARLTVEERRALRSRAQTDAVIEDAFAMLDLAQYVEVDPLHPMLVQILDYVVSIGVMTADRKTAFVAAIAAAGK